MSHGTRRVCKERKFFEPHPPTGHLILGDKRASGEHRKNDEHTLCGDDRVGGIAAKLRDKVDHAFRSQSKHVLHKNDDTKSLTRETHHKVCNDDAGQKDDGVDSSRKKLGAPVRENGIRLVGMLVMKAGIGLSKVVNLENMHVALQKDHPGNAGEDVVQTIKVGMKHVKHCTNQKSIETVQEELKIVDRGISVGNKHVTFEQHLELLPVARLFIYIYIYILKRKVKGGKKKKKRKKKKEVGKG